MIEGSLSGLIRLAFFIQHPQHTNHANDNPCDFNQHGRGIPMKIKGK